MSEGLEKLTKEQIESVVGNTTFLLPRAVGKEMSARIIKELLAYKTIEADLGIDLKTFFTVKKRGYIYYKALDGSIRESKVWAQFFGYDWCWYIRNPKKNDRKRVRMKHYGKTWALTREELEK